MVANKTVKVNILKILDKISNKMYSISKMLLDFKYLIIKTEPLNQAHSDNLINLDSHLNFKTQIKISLFKMN